MRRQAGSQDVTLDTLLGYAELTLSSPETIDFPGLIENVEGAGYTTTSIQLAAKGQIVKGHCESCEQEVSFFRLGSGQQIELVGEVAPADAPRRFGSVTHWMGKHPHLRLHDGWKELAPSGS